VLTVYHLYPELLNLYGDRGNVLAFTQRCRWRGMDVRLEEVSLGDSIDFSRADFLFIGGGSDREQSILARDMASIGEHLRAAMEDGLVVLAVCGGYQMLGTYYQDTEGQKIPGLGIMDFYTEAGEGRLIGNVAVKINGAGERVVTGFENHGGRTHLGDVKPLARVIAGHGNNGIDGTEGARWKNVFCTYLHGPVLPRNPWLTDHLISLALERQGKSGTLEPLSDQLEARGRDRILRRLKVPVTPTR